MCVCVSGKKKEKETNRLSKTEEEREMWTQKILLTVQFLSTE